MTYTQNKQRKATKKVLELKAKHTDVELSQLLNISRTTLYARLCKNNWTPQEILILEYRYNPDFAKMVDNLKILP